MPRKRYLVRLPAADRTRLHKLLKQGAAPARQLARVHILLLADEGYTDATIATMLHVGTATVARTRHKYVQHGLPAALTERPVLAGSASSPPPKKPTWSRWPAVIRPKTKPPGRCGCSPTNWSSWA